MKYEIRTVSGEVYKYETEDGRDIGYSLPAEPTFHDVLKIKDGRCIYLRCIESYKLIS